MSDLIRGANVMLMQLDQKTLTTWANECKEQARQVTHLAGEAYELLTMDDWNLEDCDEFMSELDKDVGTRISTPSLRKSLSPTLRRKASVLHPSGGGGATHLSRDFRRGGQSHGEGCMDAYLHTVSRKTTFSLRVPKYTLPIFV
jgi:hypothetical protein